MQPADSTSPASVRDRDLEVAREIAQAFIRATSPLEIYRFALVRLTPLVHASFSSVFLRDTADPTLLRLACAHNWPQALARFLSQMRVRVGRGPTGRAVAEAAPVEVTDVFADLALREWWEPARELGFTSLISLPLIVDGTAFGALTFYFDTARTFDDDERHLLRLIADQLAAASARATALEQERRELQRLRAENELLRGRIGAREESERMKDEFLSNLSHELRTPLAAILGYAGILASEQAGTLDERQRAAVERIDSSANALLRLITDLLELSQLRLGRTELQPAPDDAVLIAQRVLDAAGAPADGVEVRLEAAAERIPVFLDGSRVESILQNLVTNAYKFTSSGNITLVVRNGLDDRGRVVEWVVEDTGIGIPRDQLDAIFDEFRQVDGSSTRLYGGTGLGLALSRHLARLLGGRLLVESAEGAGSRFRLIVPQETD